MVRVAKAIQLAAIITFIPVVQDVISSALPRLIESGIMFIVIMSAKSPYYCSHYRLLMGRAGPDESNVRSVGPRV